MPKLTFANVMSAIAVFIALGGTAVALKANSVGSRAIKNETIKSRDVRDGKLKGKDLGDATITPRVVDQSVLLTGIEMRSDSRLICDPETAAFVECASVTFAAADRSRAMLVAGGGQRGEGGADGECRFRITNLSVPASQTLLGNAPPSFGDSIERSGKDANGFALTAVSDPLRGGLNKFILQCNQRSTNDVEFSATLSVFGVAAG